MKRTEAAVRQKVRIVGIASATGADASSILHAAQAFGELSDRLFQDLELLRQGLSDLGNLGVKEPELVGSREMEPFSFRPVLFE